MGKRVIFNYSKKTNSLLIEKEIVKYMKVCSCDYTDFLLDEVYSSEFMESYKESILYTKALDLVGRYSKNVCLALHDSDINHLNCLLANYDDINNFDELNSYIDSIDDSSDDDIELGDIHTRLSEIKFFFIIVQSLIERFPSDIDYYYEYRLNHFTKLAHNLIIECNIRNKMSITKGLVTDTIEHFVDGVYRSNIVIMNCRTPRISSLLKRGTAEFGNNITYLVEDVMTEIFITELLPCVRNNLHKIIVDSKEYLVEPIKSAVNLDIYSFFKILKEYLANLDTVEDNQVDDSPMVSLEDNLVSESDLANFKYIDDYKDLNSLAKENGFNLIRCNGDHGIFRNDNGYTVVIPQGRTIGKGLSIKIQKSIKTFSKCRFN